MLSIQAIRNVNYYLGLAAEDYYLNGGEPEGRWVGNGARRLRLGQTVTPDQLRQLINGFGPDGKSLVQNAGYQNRQAGWDLTFSAPKSVSVLWVNLTRQQRRRLQRLHFRAVKRAVRYLEQYVARSRVGKAGEGQTQADLVVATYEHSTSRAHDPQLHTHALVLNVGVRPDHSTGTIHSILLYQHKMIAGAIYRLEMAAGLRQEFGLKLRAKKTWFEIEGVPEQVLDNFSKRREQVLKTLGEIGLQTPSAAAMAALKSRQRKDVVPPRQELFEQWQKDSSEAGFSLRNAQQLIKGPVEEPDHQQVVEVALKVAVDYLEEYNSYFTDNELLLTTAHTLQATGVPVEEFLPLYEMEKARSTRLINLGVRDEQKYYTTRRLLAIEKEVLTSLEHFAKQNVEPIAEDKVERMLARPVALAQKPEKQISLRREQVNVVKYLTRGNSALRVVTGLAGTGKTSMLLAARKVFEASGYKVIGITPTHRARQELVQGAGIETDTIAKRLLQFESALKIPKPKKKKKPKRRRRRPGQRGRRPRRRRPQGRPRHLRKLAQPIYLDAKSVVVLDEASMVDTPTFHKLLPHIQRSGARLIVVGDEKQLPPVGPGGVFDKMVASEDIGRLAYVTRQQEEWSRQMVFELSRGRPEEFLKQHALRGCLTLQNCTEDVERKLINDWRANGGVAEPHRHVIAATTNARVDHFNDLAQQERLQAGELEAHRSIQVGTETFYVGDRVTFRKNARKLKVFNGDIGTVVAIRDWGLTRAIAVTLDGEEPAPSRKMMNKLWHHAQQLWKASRRKYTKPFVDEDSRLRILPIRSPWSETYGDLRRAYAFTTHKLQGATVDHVYVAFGDAMTDRELSYVQGSRHRETLRLYATREAAGEVLTELARHPLTSTEELKKQELDSALVKLMEQSRKQELATQLELDKPGRRKLSH